MCRGWNSGCATWRVGVGVWKEHGFWDWLHLSHYPTPAEPLAAECVRALVPSFKLEPSPQSLPSRDFCSTHAWLHVGSGLGILPSSREKGILMASLGLCLPFSE